MRLTTLRCFAAAAVLSAATSLGAPLVAQSPDLPRALAEMRDALGGDAAPTKIESFSLSADVTRLTPGGKAEQKLRVDITGQFPDKFVRATVMPNGMTFITGFNGTNVIRRTRDRSGQTVMPPGISNEQIEQSTARVLRTQRRDFARMALALFGRTIGGYPMQLAAAGQEESQGRKVDVVEASTSDDDNVRLLIDATTHLPHALAWKGRTVAVTLSSSGAKPGEETAHQRERSSTTCV